MRRAARGAEGVMSGTHRLPPHRHRPDPAEAHAQRPVIRNRNWQWHQPTGRHRLVHPNRVAGLAWPGEITARLWLRRAGS